MVCYRRNSTQQTEQQLYIFYKMRFKINMNEKYRPRRPADNGLRMETLSASDVDGFADRAPVQGFDSLARDGGLDAVDEKLHAKASTLREVVDLVGKHPYHEEPLSPTLLRDGGAIACEVEAVALVADLEEETTRALAVIQGDAFGLVAPVAMHNGVLYCLTYRHVHCGGIVAKVHLVGDGIQEAFHLVHITCIGLYLNISHNAF